MGGEGGCSNCARPYSAPYAWTADGKWEVCALDEHQSFWEVENNYARREVRELQRLLSAAYATIRELRGLKP